MDELVSVIMPSYNTEKYILDSIRSVQAQTYTNWELIIVDDCSTDNTLETVRKHVEETNENRIRLLSNEKNSGAAVSRNYALREAKGRWIAFLDSDDLWLPEKLEKQIRFMEENLYSFSYTEYTEINEESKELGVAVSGPKRITRNGMYNYCWVGYLTVMYDASVVGLIQIADIKKNNDYAMWLKAIENAECFLVEERLARYRRRSGSISSARYGTLLKWHFMMFRNGVGLGKVGSCWCTGLNMVFGIYKKLKYVNRYEIEKL